MLKEFDKRTKTKVNPEPFLLKKSKCLFYNTSPLDMKKLMEQGIMDLRQYAGKGLLILGSSKIPEGKTALVSRIIKVRKKLN